MHEFTLHRLNWCYNPARGADPLLPPPSLTQEELRHGQSEAAKFSDIRSVNVGQKIVAAVQANPSAPQAPEALYIILRMIRYGRNPVKEPDQPFYGVVGSEQTGEQLLQLRRDTARLMRRYYATSPAQTGSNTNRPAAMPAPQP